MQKNLDRMGGLVHSQRVLLALTQAGVSREDSYRLVQRNAMKVWESDGALSLMELLKADPDVAAALTAQQIEEKFNLDYHFKHVDTIRSEEHTSELQSLMRISYAVFCLKKKKQHKLKHNKINNHK